MAYQLYANRCIYGKSWTCDPNDPRLQETNFMKRVKLVPARYREDTIAYMELLGYDARGNKIEQKETQQ